MNPIRSNLMKNGKFNPFHDRYDADFILKEIERIHKKKNLEEIDKKLLMSLLSTLDLNSIYNDTYDYLKTNIFESGLSVTEIVEYCISAVNRNLIVTNSLVRKEFEDISEQDYIDIHKHRINSADPTIGKINTQAAMESSLDSLHVIINYVRYFNEILPETERDVDDIKTIEKIKRISLAGTLYYVSKTEYDQCIWNDGYAYFDREQNNFTYYYESQKNLILKKIGFFRLQRNPFGFYLMGKKLLESDKAELIINNYRINKHPKRIKEVFINNGFVKHNLVQGIDKDELDWEMKNNSEFLSYYNFIENSELPNLDNLTLKDIIVLFDTFQHLFRKASNISIEDDSVYKLNEFNKFPYKILEGELIDYLSARTVYSENQVKQFLELLTNKSDKRVNFWDYPLLKKDDYYTFPLMTIIYPIALVLADRWLEDGGFDIDSRGDFFEKHIKKTLKEELKSKGYQFIIPDNPIFRLETHKYEEIDFIANLKNICVIAEVKCIKFSMEPRDEHNALNRLTEGAKQVKRKTKFILDNQDYFKSTLGDIEDKEIVQLVITNFPTFSGYNIEGVPVVDFYLLESFFTSGIITNIKVSSNNGQNIEHETESEIHAYNNEDEFCANFNSHYE